MKSLILSLLFSMLLLNVFSQSLDTSFKLSDLQVPDAPGFVLADKAPSSIQKPVDPKTFGIDLLSLQDGGAIQVTPFWLFQHPKYDVSKYIHAVPIPETFNLSVATFKTDTTSVLTAGFKTNIIRLYSKKIKDEILKQDSAAANLIANADLPKDEEKTRVAMDSLVKIIDSARKDVFLKVELAGAYLGNSSNNSFKNLAADKAGLWFNIALSPFHSGLEFLLVSRYSWSLNSNPKIGKDTSFFDYGVSLSYQKKKLAGSLEYINRRDFSEKTNYDRVAFVINYELLNGVTLVGSFGKNFTSVNDIVTVFGVKFGIGSGKVSVGK